MVRSAPRARDPEAANHAIEDPGIKNTGRVRKGRDPRNDRKGGKDRVTRIGG